MYVYKVHCILSFCYGFLPGRKNALGFNMFNGVFLLLFSFLFFHFISKVLISFLKIINQQFEGCFLIRL